MFPTLRICSVAVLAITLPACATVETGADHVRDFAGRHPVVTSITVAVVAAGIAASVEHRHDQRGAPKPAAPPFMPLCYPNCPIS